ncbi:unnamed protein product [Zymoseptoria tritici ST99CH_3D1]|uniref:Ca2+-modulated nonselective cation channel polycystin n=3 Tax=Zymoseptoria tritici TaxID=1047171 RepID=F9X5F7_ZYMTI|nr:Ca2+-modulated nonselective cation channel polycystin [Zymoseptoria tritici IPO323]EGP88607.1 Ca2+-modulated nonselective cation channel polycystin [Zymoseptoria tritici IPO323]SMR49344.1 unnamed protein product [Zymoseptoria tritici ST99CH_3D1]
MTYYRFQARENSQIYLANAASQIGTVSDPTLAERYRSNGVTLVDRRDQVWSVGDNAARPYIFIEIPRNYPDSGHRTLTCSLNDGLLSCTDTNNNARNVFQYCTNLGDALLLTEASFNTGSCTAYTFAAVDPLEVCNPPRTTTTTSTAAPTTTTSTASTTTASTTTASTTTSTGLSCPSNKPFTVSAYNLQNMPNGAPGATGPGQTYHPFGFATGSTATVLQLDSSCNVIAVATGEIMCTLIRDPPSSTPQQVYFGATYAHVNAVCNVVPGTDSGRSFLELQCVFGSNTGKVFAADSAGNLYSSSSDTVAPIRVEVNYRSTTTTTTSTTTGASASTIMSTRTTATTMATPVNSVRNAGFEEFPDGAQYGVPTYWQASGLGSGSSLQPKGPAYHGISYGALSSATTSTDTTSQDGSLSQVIANPGLPYAQIRYFYSVGSMISKEVCTLTVSLGGVTVQIVTFKFGDGYSDGTEWKAGYVDNIPTQGGDATLEFRLHCDFALSTYKTTSVLLDEVSLEFTSDTRTPTPPAATTAPAAPSCPSNMPFTVSAYNHPSIPNGAAGAISGVTFGFSTSNTAALLQLDTSCNVVATNGGNTMFAFTDIQSAVRSKPIYFFPPSQNLVRAVCDIVPGTENGRDFLELECVFGRNTLKQFGASDTGALNSGPPTPSTNFRVEVKYLSDPKSTTTSSTPTTTGTEV